MKRYFVLVFVVFMMIMAGCGNDEQANKTNDIKESKDVSTPDSGKKIIDGVYEVGDYLSESNYLITCDKVENYALDVLVFESKEVYDAYDSSKRVTGGEENAAVEKYALYDFQLKEGETGFLSLEKGHIVLFKGGEGSLNEIQMKDAAEIDLRSGIYVVGKDLNQGQYNISCKEGSTFILFETIDTYKSYHQSSRFTGGEEDAALEKNATSIEYMYNDSQYSFNLKEGNVILIKGGHSIMESSEK